MTLLDTSFGGVRMVWTCDCGTRSDRLDREPAPGRAVRCPGCAKVWCALEALDRSWVWCVLDAAIAERRGLVEAAP